MIKVGMRQQHKVDTGGIETKVAGVFFRELAAALIEPAVDQKAPARALDKVTRPGDVAISAMKRELQTMSPTNDETACWGRSAPETERGAACVVPVQDAAPDLIRRLREPEQVPILGIDCAFVGQESDVDGTRPIFFADQHDRDRFDLAGLHQGQDFEQLIEGAKAARERDQRFRALQQMHLAERKVVESKTQLRGDIRIGVLLVRQIDIQTDGFCPNFEGAAVRSFHDPRTTTGHDDKPRPIAITATADQLAKLARDLIVTALRQNPLGHRELAKKDAAARIGFEGLAGDLYTSARRRGLRNSRAAIHHHGIANGMLRKQSLRLEILDLKAHAARLVARQESQILFGQHITRALKYRLQPRGRIRVLGGRLRSVPRQGSLSPFGVRRLWNCNLLPG